MSERGLRFVEAWIVENVNAEGYEPEGDNSHARMLAVLCLEAAKAEGISKKEIEEHVGDINDFMSQAIDEANDAEVARLAARDD